MSAGTVYLLHFDVELGDAKNPLGKARHYVGWAKHLEKRIAHHRAGTGARITAKLRELGGSFVVARTWEDRDKSFERAIKRKKSGPRLCPICQAARRSEPGGAGTSSRSDGESSDQTRTSLG